MRFFISSNIKNNKPLYVTVVLFLISTLAYWTTHWFLYGTKFGITYRSMFSYFFTDPQFPEKLPLAQLLEDIHIQLFLYITFTLVLSSIFVHKCMRDRIKYALITLSFLSGLGDCLSGLLIYFFGPAFIYLKLFFFFLFQITTGTMLALTLKLYLTKEKEEPPERSILYSIVFVFVLSTLIFTSFNFFLFASKIGLSPESIHRYYAGDPSSFIRPKTFEGMIEVFNPHLITMGVYLFALIHFSFFTNVKNKVLLSALTLLFALADNLSPFLIRFVSPHFSYLKLFSFAGLTVSMAYISLIVAVSVIRHRAKAILLI